jgi:hypothetical protein
MRCILLEIFGGNYHDILVHRNVIGCDAVDFIPAFSAGIFKCQFNVLERLMDMFIEVFGKRPILSPVRLVWTTDLLPSALAGNLNKTVDVHGLGVAVRVCEHLSGARI